MTHDELLAKIDYFVQIDKSPDGTMGIANWTKPAKALHAVVRLHYPIAGYCNRCSVNNWGEKQQKYPCDEIQAIEKELR